MDYQAVSEIAKVCSEIADYPDFFEIMLVAFHEKPGFYAQGGKNAKKLMQALLSPASKLGLYLSDKRGGYITYDKRLLGSWEGFSYYYHNKFSKNFGQTYLGYPVCCEEMNNLNLFSESFGLYYLIKRLIVDHDEKAWKLLQSYFNELLYLEEYNPCFPWCRASRQRAERFQAVFTRVYSFTPNYPGQKRNEIHEALHTRLNDIMFPLIQNRWRKMLPELRKWHFMHRFHLPDDFLYEVQVLLENPKAKQDIINQGHALIDKL